MAINNNNNDSIMNANNEESNENNNENEVQNNNSTQNIIKEKSQSSAGKSLPPQHCDFYSSNSFKREIELFYNSDSNTNGQLGKKI